MWYEPYYKTAKKRFCLIGIALLSMIFVSNVVSLIYLQLFSGKFSENVDNLFSLLCLYLFGFPVGFLVLVKAPSESRLISFEKISFYDFLKLFCVSILFLYVGSYMGVIFTGLVELISGLQQADIAETIIGDLPVWIEIPVVVIIGPIFEELFFRKRLIDITICYGGKCCIVFSAFCFGLFHGNFSQLFYAFSVGLVLGYIYYKTGKIIYTCIIHVIINFFGSYVSMWLLDGINYDALTSFDYNSIMSSFNYKTVLLFLYSQIIICLSIFGIINLIRGRRNLTSLSGSCVSYKTVFFNAGILVFTIICIGEAVAFLALY